MMEALHASEEVTYEYAMVVTFQLMISSCGRESIYVKRNNLYGQVVIYEGINIISDIYNGMYAKEIIIRIYMQRVNL